MAGTEIPFVAIIGGLRQRDESNAHLVPQWVGAPEGVVSAADKIQFASAIVVAVSAGVEFHSVFNCLQRQAKNRAAGLPSYQGESV